MLKIIDWRNAAIGAMLAVLLGGPAMAQIASAAPLREADNALVLDAMGHSLSLPLPNWLTADQRGAGAITPLVDTNFVADPSQAVLEIFPKGETQALWTTLYGARVALDSERTLAQYRDAVIALYARTCTPALTGFFQLGEDQGDTLAPLGFVCGAYSDRLPLYADQGEVMITSFKKTERGVALVYQQWRGPAFDPSVPESWPVPTDVVEARASELQDEAALVLAD